MSARRARPASHASGAWETLIGWFIDNTLIVFLLAVMLVLGGLYVSPFAFEIGGLPRDPVPVDAIPDIGENQQIVFTEWAGRSPRDVEDQITYPLTTALLGIPGVRTVRSSSAFGFSTIHVIFNDDVEFYWSRSRVLEKLASLPPGTLVEGVTPTLGPDATALGQIFWYTLEGQDRDGRTTSGWDPDELRSIQDWSVRYALQSVEGVSEVASIGGFVREYQVDVDPEALRAHGVTLAQVADAVRKSNLDVGARTLEINGVEYVVRGLGFVRDVADLEATVVASRDNTPIRIRDVGRVALGPSLRRGALDDAGAPAVGGVVVARYKENPLAVISAVKDKIAQLQPGLPTRVLEDGTTSKVTIVPFYDRTTLIAETLGTLSTALYQQILITIVVVLIMLRAPSSTGGGMVSAAAARGSRRARTNHHPGNAAPTPPRQAHTLASSSLISMMLPLGVLAAFALMKLTGVDANIMALGGIAIAIGTMVDIGIVFVENINQHLQEASPETPRAPVIRRAAAEVAPAVLTSVLTTVVSFLPVFGLSATELRLFAPLAFTKTFAMAGTLLLALLILPGAALLVLRRPVSRVSLRPSAEPPLTFRGKARGVASSMLRRAHLRDWLFVTLGLVLLFVSVLGGLFVLLLGVHRLARPLLPESLGHKLERVEVAIAVVAVTFLLAQDWLPLGRSQGTLPNLLFVGLLVALVLGIFRLFESVYPRLLAAILRRKRIFLLFPGLIVLLGTFTWLGFSQVSQLLPRALQNTGPVVAMNHAFPGLGREYMPPFDEGSYLYMPTTMPHASIGEALELLSDMDAAIAQIPEVDRVVGKLGRVESALDPAPVSMFETMISYKPEYGHNDRGERVRNWRDHVRSPRDIWDEIVRAAERPGLTGAPTLMPISARIVMLQSGMRAPMGIKVRGPSLEAIETFGLALEEVLKTVPAVRQEAVFADRVVGKPYLEIELDRESIGRYGLSILEVQNVLQVALGGVTLTRTVEGRERYPVRVRYMREERDSLESLLRVLVPTPGGEQIPLTQLAQINYVRGPQIIKSEDTFLTSYVLFDRQPNVAEVAAVEQARDVIQSRIRSGELVVPTGVSYEFAGSYENQVRSEQRLLVLIPVALALIFILLYLQFHRVMITVIIYSSVFVAVSGGFLLLWLYAQPWFLDFDVFGTSMRTLFQVRTVNMSVAVWIGFIALVGVATDDGVVLSTYLKQRFERQPPLTIEQVRSRTLEAGVRRVRPCLMTTATTILALLPVVSSQGRGADIMVPMALPSLGGMAIELLTLFVVPVLFCALEERRLRGTLASAESPVASEQP